ncbi:MAG: hypothetical protein M1834_000604 [Cirrosporium novae-zelandiae]|nr:MAG: hypothetical protein M1834_000604 [Cirrosporium novae-zelandiae]
MGDQKPYRYSQSDSLPIPTYEEATSSRPPSSQSHLGPEEISHDAERQGLLSHQDGQENERNGSSLLRRQDGHEYHAPTVESARSSLEFLSSSTASSPRSSDESLRREMVEMDVLDPEGNCVSEGSPIGHRLSKHFTLITNTLSSIHLPFRKYMPSSEAVHAWLAEARDQRHMLALRFFAIFLVMSMLYIVFISDIFTVNGRGAMQMYDPESVRIFVQSHVDESNIESYLEYLTQYDHIAGTEGNYVLAKWVQGHFKAADLEGIELEQFEVYLNYPRKDGRRVAIIDPPELAWEAKIEEEMAYKNPPREQTLVFHGHSRSGNVTGPLIYANYGSRDDFKTLADRGINVTGSIALVRYYGTQGDRALKIKAAELAGAVGCIIYSDPAEDGFVQGEPFPNGRYMPEDGVQRGGVSLMSWIVGDVLSPGFASTPGEKKRISKDNNPGLNNIPSIPLSWRDAQKLLQSLKGHGKELTDDWVGGVPEVEWWSGDQSSPTVHLMNIQDEEERQPIYNVLGQITGLEQPTKPIIIGNHRDSWCFGAADPNGGTAVMLEVVRIFGELKRLGWRPLRTIQFASWDAEEYNLVGSTEHVEARIDDLRRDGFAYVNVDVAVIGSNFTAAGSPLFQKPLLHVLDRVSDPLSNQTLRTIWDHEGKKLEGLGAGSDYVAFQDLAGTSSIDLTFDGPKFPYHSCYENFDWMTQFGDPGFLYHKAMGQIIALLILELSDRPILPYDMVAYSDAILGYVNDISSYASHRISKAEKDGRKPTLDLSRLFDAAKGFQKNSREFHDWDNTWETMVYGSGFENNVMAIKRMSHNSRMANFETHLLDLEDGGGLPGREQFKHILFAPQAWSGYDEAFFPLIRDAVDADDWDAAQKAVNRVSSILGHASRKLLH